MGERWQQLFILFFCQHVFPLFCCASAQLKAAGLEVLVSLQHAAVERVMHQIPAGCCRMHWLAAVRNIAAQGVCLISCIAQISSKALLADSYNISEVLVTALERIGSEKASCFQLGGKHFSAKTKGSRLSNCYHMHSWACLLL